MELAFVFDSLVGLSFAALLHGTDLDAPVDHPGVPFGRAEDCLALVDAVDRPELRLRPDLHHAQIGDGNSIALLRRARPDMGEIRVADVPGRCEPSTGEIACSAVARELKRLKCRGTVGLDTQAGFRGLAHETLLKSTRKRSRIAWASHAILLRPQATTNRPCAASATPSRCRTSGPRPDNTKDGALT